MNNAVQCRQFAGVTRLCCAALLLAFVTHEAMAQGGPPPASVRVGTAEVKQVQMRRLVVGRIEPAKRSIVAAERSGRVMIAPKEPGLSVTAGEVVAKIDDTLLKIERAGAKIAVEQAEAQIAEAAAQFSLARRNRERTQGLVQSNVARQKELDDVIDQESAAQARLDLTKAVAQRTRNELDRLDEIIRKTEVKAPFDAYIVLKHTEVGQWADSGDPIVELVMTSGVKVRLDVPQSLIGELPMSEPIDLQIDALQKARAARVFSVVPDADPQARTFRVLFKLDNPDGLLKPGMSVSAQLPTRDITAALTVPKDAVQTTPTGDTVYVVRGGRAQPVSVAVRFSDGDRFVIDGRIESGEQVVIEGNERLMPGQPLKVQNGPAKAAPEPPSAQ